MNALALALTLLLTLPGPAPQKSWLGTRVDGKPVQVYGWMEGGYVRWDWAENPHLATPKHDPAPEPTGPTLTATAGVTREADGTLNAGVELGALKSHRDTLDTNDADFGAGFFKSEPTEEYRPLKPSPLLPPIERDLSLLALPAAIVAGAFILGFFGIINRSRKGQS